MNPLAENANQYQPPKITVLMPVYNVSKFLPKCLQTLMDQTFRDFRLIAVNDGSTDNCLEILRDFEARYHNITVIDQPNRGMSMARNAALALADSKYICFVAMITLLLRFFRNYIRQLPFTMLILLAVIITIILLSQILYINILFVPAAYSTKKKL